MSSSNRMSYQSERISYILKKSLLISKLVGLNQGSVVSLSQLQ